jgi:hypothetical protein
MRVTEGRSAAQAAGGSRREHQSDKAQTRSTPQPGAERGAGPASPSERPTAADPAVLERAFGVTQIDKIARTQLTSGWWFTWGDEPYLNAQRTAGSIRQATANVPSTQGPGMYLAKTTHSSASSGNVVGQRVLAVNLNNTPTIDKSDNAQKLRVRGLYPPLAVIGDLFQILYEARNVVPMLLTYGGSPGCFSRLTTNEGVQERTFDLRRPPLNDLKNWYGRILEANAKQNFKTQALAWGLNAVDFP